MNKFMTLYEVQQKFIEAIDEETGEILISEEEFDNLIKNEENGLQHFIRLYKNILATAEAIKQEKLSLAKRQSACEKAAQNIIKRLDAYQQGRAYECPEGKISYRKSTTTESTDMDAFLNWDGRFGYMSFVPNPHKDDIGKAIDQGIEIPGFTRVTHNNMSIK